MPKKKKKYGGVVEHWQLHNLKVSEEVLKQVHPKAQPLMFTGTLKEDPTGRFAAGHHVRSSLILSMEKLNDNETKVETLNTIYTLKGPGGDDVMPDLGNLVLGVYY